MPGRRRAAATLLLTFACACSSAASPAANPALPTAERGATGGTSSTSPTTSTNASTSTTEPPCVPPGFAAPAAAGSEPLPDALATSLAERVSDARFAGVTLSASVWIDGYGEVVAHNADTQLLPASNQKLLTALGAAMLLPSDGVFTTELHASGARTGDTLDGDLVLVAGGDPSLTRTGPNSLDALAAQVRDAGLRVVTGALVVDVSRQELAQTGEGWQDWQIPEYAGPLSAFIVDDNRYRTDAEYLRQPAIENGEALREALRRHGVTVEGPVVDGVAPPAAVPVAAVHSSMFGDLSAEMMLRSDNEHAEMLVREVSHEATGYGQTSTGVVLVEDAVEDALCLDLPGHSGDGSGLSRADFRSARELRTVFQAALSSPWGAALDASLPVAARTGTLARRFAGTPAAGNLRAKTGSIIGGRALTGHLRTAGGRHVVLSIVVNGDGSPTAQSAIDAFVVTLAQDPS